jgi:hypothetical protein
MFPSRKQSEPMGECDNFEEERRLFYVAITRSKQGLFLSASKNRMTFGDAYHGYFPLSPFVKEIPEHLRSDPISVVLNRLPEMQPIMKALPVTRPVAITPPLYPADVAQVDYAIESSAEEPPAWLDEPPPMEEDPFLTEDTHAFGQDFLG